MRRLPKSYLTAFILATIFGALLHQLFSLLPNAVTALFSPVTESIWEHLKIIFWPFLVAAVILTRRRPGAWGRHLLSLLLISGLLLLLGWLYHIVLGKESLKFDLALYVILMALGFLLAGKLPENGLFKRWAGALGFLTLVLGAAIVLFTFLPPDGRLFADLSGASAWATIPF